VEIILLYNVVFKLPVASIYHLFHTVTYKVFDVTNNNRFWIRWFDLLALLYYYNQLWHLIINDCLRLAPFLAGPRASSLPLWRITNDESLLTHWTALMTSVWRIFLLISTTRRHESTFFNNCHAAVPLIFCFIRCHETCVNLAVTPWFLQACSLPCNVRQSRGNALISPSMFVAV
jgi:hypothetical protein